jgi:hypothetical protein
MLAARITDAEDGSSDVEVISVSLGAARFDFRANRRAVDRVIRLLQADIASSP